VNDSKPIPDLMLERYLLGELSPQAHQQLERHLASHPEDQARLTALREDNAKILAALPAAQVTTEVLRRRRLAASAKTPLRRPWLLIPATGFAAAAVLAVVLRTPPNQGGDAVHDPREPGIEQTTTKGLQPHILVYQKRVTDQRGQLLRDGESAPAQALLQLGYVAAGQPHGVLLSIDGRAQVTLHFPASQEGTTKLAAGQALLSSAYQLDDAPLFERFVLITSAQPIDVKAVMAAAQQLASVPTRARTEPLPLPAALAQTSLLLRKENP
jgi:hypothetical protein